MSGCLRMRGLHIVEGSSIRRHQTEPHIIDLVSNVAVDLLALPLSASLAPTKEAEEALRIRQSQVIREGP